MAENKNSMTEATGKEPEKATGKDTVKILLPLTRSEKDDVFVGLNGRTYLIKRGVEVDVPVGVAEVLQHSEEMLRIGMDFEASASGDGTPGR